MITEDINNDPIALAQQARDQAFQAAPFFWRDMKLHAFAIGREGDFHLHIARLGMPPLLDLTAVIPGEGDEPPRPAAPAEAAMGHYARLVWFCAVPKSKWLSAWMRGGDAAPIIIEDFIEEWTAEHVKPREQLELMELGRAIFARAHATQALLVPQDEEDEDEGNAVGPAGGPVTSARSSAPAPVGTAKSTSSTSSHKSAGTALSTPSAATTAAVTSGTAKAARTKRKTSSSASRASGTQGRKRPWRKKKA